MKTIEGVQAFRIGEPATRVSDDVGRRAIAPPSSGPSPHAARAPFRSRLPLEARRPVSGRRRRAAIFPLEGTLVDSREARLLAWLVALHECGHDFSLEMLRPLSGMGPAALVLTATGLSIDTPEGERILQRHAEIFRTWYLPRLLPFVGTRRLLQRLRRDGIRTLAVIPEDPREAADLVRASSAGDLLDDVVRAGTHEDESFLEAVQAAVLRSGCPRDSVVLVGDTPHDVAVGQRLGIDVVALRCSGWTHDALQGAVAVYDDPRDLLARYASSPFASGTDVRYADREVHVAH